MQSTPVKTSLRQDEDGSQIAESGYRSLSAPCGDKFALDMDTPSIVDDSISTQNTFSSAAVPLADLDTSSDFLTQPMNDGEDEDEADAEEFAGTFSEESLQKQLPIEVLHQIAKDSESKPSYVKEWMDAKADGTTLTREDSQQMSSTGEIVALEGSSSYIDFQNPHDYPPLTPVENNEN